MTANLLTKQSAHSVIILAAGISRRLGQPKQLLTQQGQTLLSKTIDMALHSNPVAVVVVVPQRLKDVLTVVKSAQQASSNLHIVENTTPETGLADSLKLAIRRLTDIQKVEDKHTQVKRVLIMGVDQILLDVQHLEKLLAGSQRIVASEYLMTNEPPQYQDDLIESTTAANRPQTSAKLITGLPLAIDFELFQNWQSKLTGDKGLRHLIRAMPSADICRIRNDKLSFDIDTPAQLAYARAQGWLDGNVMI